GSTIPLVLEMPEDGGIRIVGLGPDTMTYLTGPNGSVFTGVLPDGGDIVSLAATGPHLRTLLLDDMPVGQVVRHYKGSLLVARGNVLHISEPYYYGLTNSTRRYIAFKGPITVVEPCETGVFVCADQTYWLPGGLDDTQQVTVLRYGALLGSGGHMVTTDGNSQALQVFWLSQRGLVIGSSDGSAVNVQEKALKFGAARAGATLFREQDGAHHILACRQDVAQATTISDSFASMESIVKGTQP
ncbi:MAG TPA: hypothetical protein VFF19_22600, partial [Reyranella sp.]|nr:hypothetical protein [Reyranella sp.]